jgi:hypothetical protein
MVRDLASYGALLCFLAATVAAVANAVQLTLAAGFAGLFLLTAAQLDRRR